MSKKENKVCDLCHKKIGNGQKRMSYSIYDYGITIKIHKGCFENVKRLARKRNQKLSNLIKAEFCGIVRE